MKYFSAQSKSNSNIFYGYFIVIAVFFTMLFAFGTNFAFGVFFVPVRTELNWTSAMTAGAFSLSMIVQGLMGIIMGGLTDRIGPRIVMTISGILLGVGYFLMSQISSLWQLYLFYGVIIGIGMSSGYVTLLSTIARWFNIKRNLMTGIVLIGMSLGTLIAPPVSDRLISIYDWRTSYLITAIAVFVVVVVAAQFLKRDPSVIRQMSDGKQYQNVSQDSRSTIGYTLQEVVVRRQFWLFIGAEICFGLILFSILVHIIPHASTSGMSSARASMVLAAMGFFGIIGRIILGSAADRFGNKKVYITGFILLAISLLWLAYAQEEWKLYVFSAVFGFSFAGIETSESPITAWLFGLKSHGLVFGVVTLAFTIGASLGPLMTGYIFDITGQYRLAFIILAIFSIAGLLCTAFLRSLVTNKQ